MKTIESLQATTSYEREADMTPTTLALIQEHVVDGKLLLDEKSQDELSSAMDALYENPGERIKREFEALSELYRARSVRETDQLRSGSVEYTMFGTRTADGSQLEEIFTKIDERNAGNKAYCRTTYQIDLLDNEKSVAQVVVDPEGQTRVTAADDRDDTDVLIDVGYRTVIAEVRSAQRDEAEQAIANDSAARLLNKRLYGTERPVITADE